MLATTIEVMSQTVILYENTPLHEQPSLYPRPEIGNSWRSAINSGKLNSLVA